MKNFRINQLGIQMIPEFLHRKLFAKKFPVQINDNRRNVIIDQLKKSIQNIEFKIDNISTASSSIETRNPWKELIRYLPELIDNDVLTHMNNLGQHYSRPYLKNIEKLLQIPDNLLENRPKKWLFNQGWTRYELIDNDNRYKSEPVEYPLEDSLVFDVEVSLDKNNYNRPTLAVALSPNAWYSWCSDALISQSHQDQINDDFNLSNRQVTMDDLIPMGQFKNQERLIVGHNVSFDRSYIREQYQIDLDQTRFLDTMSLHICVSGLNQEQKMFTIRNGGDNPWQAISSLNNLNDVYKLYCQSKSGVSKDPRNVFIKGTMADVFENFSHLTDYCANDVSVTLQILKSLFPQFRERFPSPITLAGMLEMSVMYLPVNQHTWKRYLDESQSIYNQYKNEINETLKEIACESCQSLSNDQYRKDPWLWDLNWTTRNIGYKKAMKEIQYDDTKFKDDTNSFIKELIETKKYLKKMQPILPGYPQWFVELCENSRYLNKIDQLDFNNIFDFDQFNITTKLRTIPKILKLMWMDYPLYFDQTYGWGHLVPLYDQQEDSINFPPFETMKKFLHNNNHLENLDMEKCIKEVQIPGCLFFKLPHKDGPNKRVGNPLSKDFIKKISDGTLKSAMNTVSNDLVAHQNKISYWVNSSKRILSQLVIPYDPNNGDGSILPRVVVCGTVTRRAVEPTWLTASNSYPERLGSELKGIIQCPTGYSYVGADVDSQELWIASLLGDSNYCGIQGSTGLSWMTLKGERSRSTDMHSVTAATINIRRDEAKVLNYARIYGSGMEFAARFLKQSNPALSEQEAKMKAKKIFHQTKGQRKKTFIQANDGDNVQWIREWYGGTESSMFNKLEKIATSQEPATPFLQCRISRALEPMAVGHDYMTSRVNWAVQSSAVDFLHIILIAMKWLMQSFQIHGRFSISIHDEIRYIINDEHRFRAALALQFANLLTRSYFTSTLNLNDLPESVAFFSSIEIDKCLRKDSKDDCKTPSNSLGLSKGYGIASGISINVYELLDLLQNDQSFNRMFDDDDSNDDQRIKTEEKIVN
ncbi:DNA polymerase gamma, catalytic subunit tam [Dermatophagoides pteronyssinus]|uniref:DNA polymerase gamma, catalytic subunit tam n=1 Tax=Dermatophagoides pteronyssinus TaxID=6956 RepID=UPI003F675A69